MNAETKNNLKHGTGDVQLWQSTELLPSDHSVHAAVPISQTIRSEHSDRSDMLRLCRPLKPPSILLFYTNRKLSVLNINKHTKFILCSKYKNNVQPFKTIKHSDSVNLWNVFHHSRLSVIFTPLHTCSVTYINTVFPQYIVSAGHHCNVIESEIHSCVQKTP